MTSRVDALNGTPHEEEFDAMLDRLFREYRTQHMSNHPDPAPLIPQALSTAPPDAGGYVKLYRKALQSDLIRRGGLRLLGLWAVLLLEAAWTPKRVNGEALQAGQLLITLRPFAKAHGLSVKELRGSLANLERNGSIWAQQKAHRYTLITIGNWGAYQGEREREGHTEGQTEGTVRAHRGHTEPLKCPSIGASRAPKKERRKEERKDIVGQARLVVLDLNEVTGKQFKPESKGTLRLIEARFREGYTLGDFKRVHRTKAAQWRADPRMRPYLRPETLYTPGHFESYLNEARPAPPSNGENGTDARLKADLQAMDEALEQARPHPQDREAYFANTLAQLGKYPGGIGCYPPILTEKILQLRATLSLEGSP